VITLRTKFEELRTLGFAAIGAGWTPVGAPFEFPSRTWKIFNRTNVDLMMSDDGIKAVEIIPAGIFWTYSITNLKTDNQGLFTGKGVQIYVKAAGALPASGSVYLSTMYAEEK
jgi:hypothetical protein